MKKDGVFFPIDPSTASRATIGGMTANNSSGARSIRYGNMVHNVRRIEGVLQTGEPLEAAQERLATAVRAIAAREADEIAARFPKVLRRVGGYNLDLVTPATTNLAPILVGSEGTLAFFSRIHLALSRLPPHAALGIAHFATFYAAMDAAQHLVKLDPVAVELIDGTMIELSREIAAFRPTMEKFVRGTPEAILLVEFTGDEHAPLVRKLDELDELMASLGFPDSVVKLPGAADQAEMWTVRRAGLDIMSSMKGDRKPVSIIEDCAVPLEHLAEYTAHLNEIFDQLRDGRDVVRARLGRLPARAPGAQPQERRRSEEAARDRRRSVRVRAGAYKGSHSGEHGDGIVRSEFHAEMFGERIVRAFEDVKDAFDPAGLFNPGKIVRAPQMDDRRLFRYQPGYAPMPIDTVLDWSEWGGFLGAVEMCNNNGACRKDAGGDVSVVTWRRRTKRTSRAGVPMRCAWRSPASSGATRSPRSDMYEDARPLRGLQGLQARVPDRRRHGADEDRVPVPLPQKHGYRLKDKLVADLPRRAPLASRFAPLMNAAGRLPFVRRRMGFSARRSIPHWSSAPVYRTIAEDGDGRSRALRRHVRPLFRARNRARGDPRPRTRRIPRDLAGAARSAAVLRTHLSLVRDGRRGTRPNRAHDRRARRLRCARPPDRRPRAVVPAYAAR